jgi:hypothetical protein
MAATAAASEMTRRKVTDVRIVRSLTDRLLGRVAPEVTAAALWITQHYCVPSGCAGRGQDWVRQCHDGSGYCTPWVKDGCGC